MQCNTLLNDEKAKLLTLIKKKFVKLDFSKIISVVENNLNDPLWMDIYILIYKSQLPPDIKIYDILLNKLSTPIFRINFAINNQVYMANIDNRILSRYIWYLITNDSTQYYIESQFVPNRDYFKEIIKFSRFSDAGIYLENIDENKFCIKPTKYQFDNEDDASVFYNKFLDAYDIYRSIKLNINNFTDNIDYAIEYGKDKRMIATLSNILSYFDLKFVIKDGCITLENLEYRITNESEADKFQVKLIDAYQFFRNVINTENKRDIVSEIYNKRLKPEIRKEFEDNIVRIFRALKNQELVDWIITISKESKYSLNILFDNRGVFYIDGNTITNAYEAKMFYIDYMDKKKEKLSMTIYKNSIISKIKSLWNKFRARFAKI